MLGEAFLGIAAGWQGLFARASSFERSIALALGLLCAHGRATTSSAIIALGKKGEDWSADYKLFSRAPWEAERLFDCAVRESLPLVSKDWVVLAYDDTRLKKSGKKIAHGRLIIATVDGSFCNKPCLTHVPERTAILGRARKDAKLCFAESAGSRRKYCLDKFTPESVLKDQTIPFKTVSVVFGGAQRELKYKQVENVLWQGGAKTKRLTLLVLAPTPYRVSPNGPRNYRDPAFLLCTMVGLDAQRLVQAYLDRWQIEVNHKDEKDILGVGQAQVWSLPAIPRQPAFAVAAYSILLLATLRAFGPGRTNAFPPLPRWRKQQRRPSLADMIALLRTEFNDPNSAITQRLDKSRLAQDFKQKQAA
jgi:hypothetical protein